MFLFFFLFTLLVKLLLGVLVSLWVVFLILAVLFNVLSLRRKIFSCKLLSFYRQRMPQLSITERAALTAGNVGWEGELFSWNAPIGINYKAFLKTNYQSKNRHF